MTHEENKTYEFAPDSEDASAWNIRILEGMFNETVIRYVAIYIGEQVDESGDSMMTFNFELISSPDSELTSEDKDLQEVAGEILLSIIESSIKNNDGSMAIKLCKQDKDDEDGEWEIVE